MATEACPDLSDLIEVIQSLPALTETVDLLKKPGQRIHLSDASQRILPLLTSALAYAIPHRLLVITPNRDTANRLVVELEDLATHVYFFRSGDEFPRDAVRPHREVLASRFEVLDRLCSSHEDCKGELVVAPLEGLLQPTLPREDFETKRKVLEVHDVIDPMALSRRLMAVGYEPVDKVEGIGEMSRRGCILDLFPPGAPRPYRLEFFGDEIVSIRCFSSVDQQSVDKREWVELIPASERLDQPDRGRLFDYMPQSGVCVWVEPAGVDQRLQELREAADAARAEKALSGKGWWEGLGLATLVASAHPSISHVFCSSLGQCPDLPDLLPARRLEVESVTWMPGEISNLSVKIAEWSEEGLRVAIVCNNEGERDRMKQILGDDADRARLLIGSLEAGFILPGAQWVVLTDQEIFHRYEKRYLRRTPSHVTLPIANPAALVPGELVVHANYGIGRYVGLQKVDGLAPDKEVLCIEYADREKVYLPLEEIHLIDKYIGPEDRRTGLNALDGSRWEITKRRVSVGVMSLARDLLEVFAHRETLPGFAFPEDGEWQQEFERSFIYPETPDQTRAILEVKKDMESSQPMDRLVCGDVGFGKTEIAVRAAFKACMAGKQTAVLVPTTVLAQQHLKTFRERMADYPVRIEALSRFLSHGQQARALKDLAAGQVDIIIGTHRLIQKDVMFKDLGLVIVDEEQRFGVLHKERLKRLRRQVDVLTLTATPIPRTLHMTLLGIRDMSVMETPPEHRLPIGTWVEPFDFKIIREAILREMNRGGQVYLVHNRVKSIERLAAAVRRAVPEARVAVGHGQLPERALEKIMVEFTEHRYDVLICTTIIESGLDIPNVNTLIIDRSDRFGLAQMYQLRGRVGRYVQRAYAYLLIPRDVPVTPEAQKRLAAIAHCDQLGAGFQIAMKDLEIRGAGNILGPEQHGLMVAVGFNMYIRLLKRAVADLKGEAFARPEETKLDVETVAYLPDSYVPGEGQRIEVYRNLTMADSLVSLDQTVAGIRDRFGPLPSPVQALVAIARIRILAAGKGLSSISRERVGFVLCWREAMIPPAAAESLEKAFPDRVTLAHAKDRFGLAVNVREELTRGSELDILQRVVMSCR